MYEIRLSKKSVKFLKSLDQKTKKEMNSLFHILKINPLPFNKYDVVKIRGDKNRYRIKLRNNRILYLLITADRIINIEKIGARENFYKK